MTRHKELKRRSELFSQAIGGLDTMPTRKIVTLRRACYRATIDGKWTEHLFASLMINAIRDEMCRRDAGGKRRRKPIQDRVLM